MSIPDKEYYKLQERLKGLEKEVAEHKEEEERLRKSEQKFRFLAEKIDDILWTIDMKMKTTYVSPSVKKVLGFTPEERLAQKVEDQLTPRSLALSRATMAKELLIESMRGGDPDRAVSLELEYYHKDGSIRILHNVVSGVRDGRGRLVGFYGVSRDITEHKRFEENVERAAEEWQKTFDSMADGVSIHAPDFEIKNVNQALCDMLGKRKEQLIGKKCFQVFHGESGPLSVCPLKKTLESGKKESIEVYEPTIKAWLSVASAPIFGEKKRIVEIVHVVRDISEWKKAEEDLARKIKELETFCKDAVGREDKILELKEEIRKLRENRG